MTEFSIVTPSLNSARVIGRCIDSVANQSIKAEHVVIDGNSTDQTQAIIEASASNIRLIRQTPHGIYPAINAGVSACNGEIIGILHADDFYCSTDVLEQVATVFKNAAIDACYGDLCYVDASETSRVVRYWRSGAFDKSRFMHGWMPPHPTFFVRRKCYEAFGLYRTDLGTSADYEMTLRLLVKHGVQAAYIAKVLVYMRTGGASNASLRARINANRMDRRAWKVNELRPYPWTFIAKPVRKIGQWWQRS